MVRSVCARFLFLPCCKSADGPERIAREILAPLLDPAKVDTLRDPRPINARGYTVLYCIEMARRGGAEVSAVVAVAQAAAGYEDTARAKEDKRLLERNHARLAEWG